MVFEQNHRALRELMYWGGLGSGMSMSMSMPTDSADDSDSSVPPLPDANATLVPDVPDVTNFTGADDNTTATPSDMPSDMPSDVPSAVPTMSPTVATTSATTIAPTGTDIGAAGANGNTIRGGGSNQRAEKGKIAGVTITLLVAAAVGAALFARKMHKNSAASGQSMSDSSDSDQDGMA